MSAPPSATPSHSPTFLSDYAELHCQSNFTFLRGASHPEELVQRALDLGYTGLAITDECSLAGVVRAHVQIQKHEENQKHKPKEEQTHLRLIIGSTITFDCGAQFVFLAKNIDGYGNLSELITLGRRRADKGFYTLYRSDIEPPPRQSHDQSHLARLPDCIALLIPQRNHTQKQIAEQAEWAAQTFGHDRAWIAVELLHWVDDAFWLEQLNDIAAKSALPLVAAGNVLMHVRSRKPLQDTLTAVRLGKPIAECGLDLQPNAEQHLRSRIRLAQIYSPSLLKETFEIISQCDFSLTEISYQYPREIVPEGETLSSYLRKLTFEGAATHRYPKGMPAHIKEKIEHELKLITDLKYEPFFLTVYDIVRFARSENILCQGRGSAANSIVCYCLGITEVDPEQCSVLFERFVSRERGEPPDIDVDFEHQRREQVMQYIYNKYGRHRAAIAASLITYRPRSAMKDVGKALGLDFEQVHRLSSSHKWWDGREVREERLRECGFDPQSPIVQKLVELTETLIGFPRHLSQHVGGFVIAQDKLSRLVPIENASMKDRSVIQWDKDDLDALRLLKVDVLALGMLSAIRRSLEMISAKLGYTYRMQDVPREESSTYNMICKADTIGVFQIESRAQMSMLPRLLPREYYDLVVQVAIVRPGPIQGGMVHPYLTNRRIPKDEIKYYKNEIKPALERTRGVPIFQEQVMQIAMLGADFSAGKADDLRRSMAAWKRKGDLEKYNQELREGLAKNEYPTEFAERLIQQIQGFGSYGFPESHAASFAHLVYVSAWIKCNYPAAFLAGLLNSQPMGFYSASQLVQDAKRHGVIVLPVDVTMSDIECTLENVHADEPPVRLGLQMIKGLSIDAAERIVKARAIQPFHNIDDLARRAELDQFDLGALARANALLPLTGHRRQAKWEVSAMKPAPALLRNAPINEAPLMLPPATEGQEIVADYHSTGLTLNRHPLALLRPRLKKMNLSTALEMKGFADCKIARTCGIVTMRQRPPTAKGTMFVTLEDETGITNVIIWPALVEKQRKEVLNSQLMTVYGIWQTKEGVHHLVAKRIVDHTELLGNLSISSRDFQ